MPQCLQRLIFMIGVFFSGILFSQPQSFPWAKSASGTGIDEGIAVCNDPAGNVLVTGHFTSPVITFGTFTLANNGGSTVFLVKYDCNGVVLWARSAGCTGTDYGNAITADASGNIFITGYFQSPAITFGSFTLTNNGSYDLFLTKYDPNGNVLWARSAGGSGNDYGYSAKTDQSGNVFVTGSHSSPAIVFGSYTLTNSGASDGYLAKYNSAGNVLWVKDQAGSSGDENWSVCTDAGGNAYITGDYVSPSVVFGAYTIINTGICPVYIAKYDSNGNALWAQSAGGTNYDFSNWITDDAAGNIIITGCFTSATMIFGTYTLSNNGNEDVFIAKYSANGNVLWAKAAGSPGTDKGYSMSADANSIYCTGSFTNSIVFGSNTLTAPAGEPDPMFIVTYDYNGNVKCATYLKSGGDDQTGISADNSGYAYITADLIPNPFVVGTTTLIPNGGENVFVAKYLCGEIMTGVNNNNQLFGATIFPNPNNGSFKIQIDNEIENGELVVINMFGQKIHEQKIVKGENNIKASGMAAGLYHYIILQNKLQVIKGQVVFE